MLFDAERNCTALRGGWVGVAAWNQRGKSTPACRPSRRRAAAVLKRTDYSVRRGTAPADHVLTVTQFAQGAVRLPTHFGIFVVKLLNEFSANFTNGLLQSWPRSALLGRSTGCTDAGAVNCRPFRATLTWMSSLPASAEAISSYPSDRPFLRANRRVGE